MRCNLKRNRDKTACRRHSMHFGEGEFSLILPKRDNSKRPIKPVLIQKYIIEKNKFMCEDGLKITGVRDFDGKYASDKFKRMSSQQRKRQLDRDYKELKKLAKESAKEFGQDSIMVTYDGIVDADFMGNDYSKKISRKSTGKRVIFP